MALKEVEDIVKKAKKSKGESTARAAELAVSNAKETVSKDVRKLSETKWQITGDAAKKIQMLSENFDKIKDRATEMVKEAHQEMWRYLYEVTETDKKGSYKVDVDHMKEGIVFMEKKKGGSGGSIGGIGDLLRHIMEGQEED